MISLLGTTGKHVHLCIDIRVKRSTHIAYIDKKRIYIEREREVEGDLFIRIDRSRKAASLKICSDRSLDSQGIGATLKSPISSNQKNET